MYRFALRPRWLLSHVLVLVLVVVMVNLGLWQLRRLDEKRSFNDRVRAAAEVPEADLDSVLDVGDSTGDGSAAAYRRVVATGRYDSDREVLVRSRSQGERPGVWVLTPLEIGDGVAVIVCRGFIPTQGVPERVPESAAAPGGSVTVHGQLMATQTKGRFGATDPPDGTLTDMARVDLERIQQQVPYELYPAWVQLAEQDPAQAGFPEPVPPPGLDEGPHLSYALQWFTFSAIAVAGYPLILRRQARQADLDATP